MSLNFTPIIAIGTLILITDVNGLISSHIANEVLKLGYRVRGVVRSEAKSANRKKCRDKAFPGLFEFAIVPDLLANSAYDEAIKSAWLSSLNE
ncbi:hypothetical protein JCM8547_000682 [Rhodosporidiobolus lusitaniae]